MPEWDAGREFCAVSLRSLCNVVADSGSCFLNLDFFRSPNNLENPIQHRLLVANTLLTKEDGISIWSLGL